MKILLYVWILFFCLNERNGAIPTQRNRHTSFRQKTNIYKISLDRMEVSSDAKTRFLQTLAKTHKSLSKNTNDTTSHSDETDCKLKNIHELKLGNYKNAQVNLFFRLKKVHRGNQFRPSF